MELDPLTGGVTFTHGELLDCLLLPWDFVTDNPSDDMDKVSARLCVLDDLGEELSELGAVSPRHLPGSMVELGKIAAWHVLTNLIEGEGQWGTDEEMPDLMRELHGPHAERAQELHQSLAQQARKILDKLG